MGIWSSLAGGVMTVVKGTGSYVIKPIGQSVVNTVAHPAATVANISKAARVGALPAAGGYLAWEKIANDKSVIETVKDVAIGEDKSLAEAVSDVAIGEKTTERIGSAIDSVADAADKASETMDTVNQAVGGQSGGMSGIGSFFQNISSGEGITGMISNLFSNIFKGNVSGLSMAGLAAAAFLTFGKFGWMGRIAGALLGMMLIGNNSKVSQTVAPAVSQQQEVAQDVEQNHSRGMRR